MKIFQHLTCLIHTSGKKPSFTLPDFSFKKQIPGISALLTVFMAATSSCSMVNEDLSPCAPAPNLYTVVNFEYTYNMSAYQNTTGREEDWFDSHAGSVYLYVFDQDGIYLNRYSKHKEFFAPGETFEMSFSQDELQPGKTYNLVAVAQGNTIGYTDDDNYNWFKVVNPMEPGVSSIKDYLLKLDRDTNNDGFAEIGVVNYKDQYGNTQQMIDTLWTTKPDEVQTISIPKYDYTPSVEQQPDIINEVTIPMMRITNAITVNLVASSFDADTDYNKYHIVIHYPNGNGTIDFCGDISQSSQELYYQSLVKRMAPYKAKPTKASGGYYDPSEDEGSNQYALQALFGVSRLLLNDDSSLQIRDANKPEEGYPVLLEIPNFSNVLAQLCNETVYGDQEFLDREYDFQIDLAVKDDDISGLTPIYMDISCHVLAWAKRIHFYDL